MVVVAVGVALEALLAVEEGVLSKLNDNNMM